MIREAIVKAIKNSGKSRYRIAKDTGIDPTVLHRLVNGGSCNLETADKLLNYLGLEVRPPTKPKKGR